MTNFHPLEVVGRGSGTQLQMGLNLNYLIYMVNQFVLYLKAGHSE